MFALLSKLDGSICCSVSKEELCFWNMVTWLHNTGKGFSSRIFCIAKFFSLSPWIHMLSLKSHITKEDREKFKWSSEGVVKKTIRGDNSKNVCLVVKQYGLSACHTMLQFAPPPLPHMSCIGGLVGRLSRQLKLTRQSSVGSWWLCTKHIVWNLDWSLEVLISYHSSLKS